MLEIFRSCPKCGAHAKAEDERCASCGQPLGTALGQPVSRLRRRITIAVVAVLVLAAAVALVKPELYTLLLTGRMPEVTALAPGRPRWTYGGAEPAARTWAWKLEKSLAESCSGTYTQFTERKKLEPTLDFQLLGGNVLAAKQAYELAKKNHTEIPKLTADEVQDALTAVGSYDAFVAACLARSYQALEPCEKFKASLASPEGVACLQPPVQKVLGSVAYRICSANAKQPRVKTLCQVVADRTDATMQSPALPTGM